MPIPTVQFCRQSVKSGTELRVVDHAVVRAERERGLALRPRDVTRPDRRPSRSLPTCVTARRNRRRRLRLGLRQPRGESRRRRQRRLRRGRPSAPTAGRAAGRAAASAAGRRLPGCCCARTTLGCSESRATRARSSSNSETPPCRALLGRHRERSIGLRIGLLGDRHQPIGQRGVVERLGDVQGILRLADVTSAAALSLPKRGLPLLRLDASRRHRAPARTTSPRR